jgi:hypothetical protein
LIEPVSEETGSICFCTKSNSSTFEESVQGRVFFNASPASSDGNRQGVSAQFTTTERINLLASSIALADDWIARLPAGAALEVARENRGMLPKMVVLIVSVPNLSMRHYIEIGVIGSAQGRHSAGLERHLSAAERLSIPKLQFGRREFYPAPRFSNRHSTQSG